MSEKKATAYERTRDAILLGLYDRYKEVVFPKDGFERILEEDVGIGDDRTVRKYWKKFSKMGYIQLINASSAKLSSKIAENEGRINPLEEAETEIVAEVAKEPLRKCKEMIQ